MVVPVSAEVRIRRSSSCQNIPVSALGRAWLVCSFCSVTPPTVIPLSTSSDPGLALQRWDVDKLEGPKYLRFSCQCRFSLAPRQSATDTSRTLHDFTRCKTVTRSSSSLPPL